MNLDLCGEKPQVMPFVKEHIADADWRYRDAAIMAFGSILEGPKVALKPIMEEAILMLITLMKDPSIVVRDTAAWTVGRVCDILPEAVITEKYLQPLLEVMMDGLSTEPRVATNICWAFCSLAEAAFELAKKQDDQPDPDTYCLSRYFEPIITKLLKTTDRTCGNQHDLRSAAYEALMELVKNSPKDCYSTVRYIGAVLLSRLQDAIVMGFHIQSSSDEMQIYDLQSLLCVTFQSVLRKVRSEDAPKMSIPIMLALLQMLNTDRQKTGGVQEDALLTVGTLIEALNEGFLRHMDDFKPFLLTALRNYEEHQMFIAAVGIVGDLSRALSMKILPYCDEMMTILLETLHNDQVNWSVKPKILSIFGDIALAIGTEFTKYLDPVLSILQQTSQAQVNRAEYNKMEYLNELREGCLEAYTGIIQGLKGDVSAQNNSEVMLIHSHVPHITHFLEVVAVDDDNSDAVIGATCGLIGDLLSAFSGTILPLIEKDSITNLLTKGQQSKTSKTKTLATWATREIRKLKNLTS